MSRTGIFFIFCSLLTLLMTLGCASLPALKSAPCRKIQSIVALGSSSTEGQGASDREKSSFVALINTELHKYYPELQTLNLGSGGARVGQFLKQLPEIKKAKPDLVIILPFSDYKSSSAEDFEKYYEMLFNGLAELKTTLFFGDQRYDPAQVCGQGSANGVCYSQADYQNIQAKNKILTKLTRNRPFIIVVPIIDTNAAHPEWTTEDGHPNDKGHKYLAQQFWQQMSPWLTCN
jgi:hypothetical protein